MGYNSTLIVLNDALDQIKGDPDFGKKVAAAISRLCLGNGPIDISSGNHCNAATAIESHHADINRIVLVGGNCGQSIDDVYLSWNLNVNKSEDREQILKRLAEEWGFSVRKKRKVA